MKKRMFFLALFAALVGCQAVHRGVNANIAAPVLSGNVPGDVTWIFNGPNPNHWRVEQLVDSDNTGNKWHWEANLPGNMRTFTLNTNSIPVRIVGQNKKNRDVTPYSNVISTF